MPVWLLRNLTKISVVLFAGLIFFAAEIVGKILLIGIVGVALYGYLQVKGGKAGYAPKGIAGAGAFI